MTMMQRAVMQLKNGSCILLKHLQQRQQQQSGCRIIPVVPCDLRSLGWKHHHHYYQRYSSRRTNRPTFSTKHSHSCNPMNHERSACYMSTTTSTVTSSSNSSSSSSSSSSILYYALGGWIFFIAENVLLSENRTAIISYLQPPMDTDSTDDLPVDESYYRMIYGTFSTAATLSILYGYRQLRILNEAATKIRGLTNVKPHTLPTIFITSAAVSIISLGLVLVSQSFPKLQIPIELSSGRTTNHTDQTTAETNDTASVTTVTPTPDVKSNAWALKVRCPFDFTDSKPKTTEEEHVRGMDRVTRHSGLWSFGFVGLGNALLQSSFGLSLFMTGPILVALIGGYHYDTRLQRNIGGSFPSKTYEQQTSNVPFLAMILGQQKEQKLIDSFSTLVTQELKLLNATVAIIIATLYVALNKGRHVSYIGHILSSSSTSRRISTSTTGKSTKLQCAS